MGIIVEPGDPRDPAARDLLGQSHSLMRSLFSPEDNHFLDVERLAQDDILFFVAREFGATLGTGALALRDGYGEVKSMFTAPFVRGRGVAGMILDRLELEARARGLPLLRLETGTGLDAAHRLYARMGFRPRGPFGDYEPSAYSVFLEKPLV